MVTRLSCPGGGRPGAGWPRLEEFDLAGGLPQLPRRQQAVPGQLRIASRATAATTSACPGAPGLSGWLIGEPGIYRLAAAPPLAPAKAQITSMSGPGFSICGRWPVPARRWKRAVGIAPA